MSSDLDKNYAALRNEIMQSGLVEDVATSSSRSPKWKPLFPGQLARQERGRRIRQYRDSWVSGNYFKTTGMQIIAGRDFSPNIHADTLGVIFNEAAIRRMGLQGSGGPDGHLEWQSIVRSGSWV